MARVQLVVYNVLGQQVAVLADGEYPAGNHQVTWNGTDRNGESVASGVYLYRLSTDAENLTRKMMLLK
jgi:flagellar hook assembly protein FlgD